MWGVVRNLVRPLAKFDCVFEERDFYKNKVDLIVKNVSYNELKPGLWKVVKLKADEDLIVYIYKQNTLILKSLFHEI